MEKRIVFIIIVGFVIIKGLMMFITFESYTVSAATIYVGSGPGNHTNSIQDAIDNFASDGDTIYVYSGTYSENVMIEKTLTLIGEDKEYTIIDGGGSKNVATIYQVPYVNISGFTITNSGSGPGDCGLSLTILSHHCNISDNRFLNNLCGIRFSCSCRNSICNNNVSLNNEHGFDLFNSSRNTIKDNHVFSNTISGIHLSDYSNENLINGNAITYNNFSGLSLFYSSKNNITKNKVLNNYVGLSLIYSSDNNITYNEISGNYHGIETNVSSNYNTIIKNNIHSNSRNGICFMFSSDENLIRANDITNNGIGISLFYSSNNHIYHNNIIDNVIQALDNTNMSNYWDNGYPSGGNYWSDYTGVDLNSTPTQNVPPPDGIGDTRYLIDSNSRDNYPLMEPVQRSLPPLRPPTLYINISQDGKDVILSWDPTPAQVFDPYLIYRSTDPTNFDFSTPWVNTLTDKELGEPKPIPDRNMWNDTNAAFPGNLTNYKEQYYYVIRAFNGHGEISSTSRTVGKWTKIFPQGISTFSLPLGPIIPLDINYFTSEMRADYIKYINQTTHKWMKHNFGDGDINNTQIKPGEGYEVKFNNQTNFTFTGLPGAMINYDNDTGFLGFDYTTAKNLTVTVESNGDVNLTWKEPSSMVAGGWYEVYYSNNRDGFLGTPGIKYKPACPSINFGINTTTITGLGANDPGARLYFMVVPFNASGVRGSSTYSIGVWTEEYLSQYDTFGIPLQLSACQTADWYCDNIPNAVGINYYNTSEHRWFWHSRRMPSEAYDPILEMTEGYQISTLNATKFIFIGV